MHRPAWQYLFADKGCEHIVGPVSLCRQAAAVCRQQNPTDARCGRARGVESASNRAQAGRLGEACGSSMAVPMTDVSADQLQATIEGQHGGKASLAYVDAVTETFQGRVVWDGLIHVFDLDGHPKATRAYAWSSPV